MSYLLGDQASERERLQLQSRVWEPAGERLLARLGDGCGLRALEVGCGAMGWLRILSRWVGSGGEVVGTDVDARMLEAAAALVAENALANVSVTRDERHFTVGIYSTPSMWKEITGGWQNGLPAWVGGGTKGNAPTLCGVGFTGGSVYLVQYARSAYDGDYAC